MRIPRIYYHEVLKINMTITLDLRNCHYLLNVLRVKKGRIIIVFNGDGNDYKAEIVHIQKKQIEVVIQSQYVPFTESPLFIELAQGISHSDTMDYILQKAVELGVKRIIPLITDRSAKIRQRFLHWEKIVISACEQSGRAQIPKINKPQHLNNWLLQKRDGISFVCDLSHQKTLSNFSKNIKQVTILIGPEGGFSKAEIQQAVANHFIRLYLGPRILRTETATVAALSLLQGYLGDLNYLFP